MLLSRRTLTLTGLAIAAVNGCSAEPKVETLTGDSAYVAQNPKHPLAGVVAVTSQQIGWRPLIRGDYTGNQLVSPALLYAALALVGLGIMGASTMSLDELFGMNFESRAAGTGVLRAGLADYTFLPESTDTKDPPEKPIINPASRFLICSDVQPKFPFLGTIRKRFDTSVGKVKDSEAQASLDVWTEENTAGLIEQSGITVTHDAVLVVQDTLLFASCWGAQFRSDNVPLALTIGGGETAEIKVLSDSLSARTTFGWGWQVVRLSYDENLAMSVILPDQGIHPLMWDVSVLQETHEKLSAAPKNRVEATMPPTGLAVKRNLKGELTRLEVDFNHLDGIFDGAGANQAAQQVRLQVGTKGIVDTALTEVKTPVGVPVNLPTALVVDHPYVMWVLDVRKGWPLFLAAISNPEAK